MNTTWILLFVIFLIIEIVTTGTLVSIWFCIGSIVAFVAQYIGASIALQFLLFFVVSISLLLITKPLIRKYVKPKISPTNADRIIDTHGVVNEEINNLLGKGSILVDGKTWTARNIDGEALIPIGSEVIIIEIKGVKAFVRFIV